VVTQALKRKLSKDQNAKKWQVSVANFQVPHNTITITLSHHNRCSPTP
jgi:hypothetical protein